MQNSIKQLNNVTNPKNCLIGICLIVYWSLVFGFLSGCGDTSSIVSISVSPSSATIGINRSQLFSATGRDSAGMLTSITPTWSISSGIGSISSGGLFTAASSSGEGQVIAAYDNLSAQASVSVTTLGWVAGKVYNSQGSLVNGSKVYLKNTSLFNFTNSSGNYSISSVPAGTYEAWIDATSVYRAASNEVTVASGETKTAVNFTLLFFTDPPDLNPPEYTY